MQSYQYRGTIPLTVTFIIINCFVNVRPASAQLLELATSAFSILNSVAGQSNSQQQGSAVARPQQSVSSSPLSNGKFDVGTENFNGNTINLCISGCLPGGSQPATPPSASYPIYPASPAQAVSPANAANSANSPNSTNPANAANSASPAKPTNATQTVQPSSTSSSQSQSDKSTNYLPLDFSQL